MKSRGLGWAHRGIASCHLRGIHTVSTVTPSKARGRCKKHTGFKDREGKGGDPDTPVAPTVLCLSHRLMPCAAIRD